MVGTRAAGAMPAFAASPAKALRDSANSRALAPSPRPGTYEYETLSAVVVLILATISIL